MFDKFASPREARPQEFAGQESNKRHSIREAIDHGSGERPSIAILATGS